MTKHVSIITRKGKLKGQIIKGLPKGELLSVDNGKGKVYELACRKLPDGDYCPVAEFDSRLQGYKQAGVVERQVDDPSATDANYLEEKKRVGDLTKVGKVLVRYDPKITMGGYGRFQKRPPDHEMAAVRFRNAYENGQVGGAKAQEPRDKVDGSCPNPDLNFIIGCDARRDWLEAQAKLTAVGFIILERLVVHDTSGRQIMKDFQGTLFDGAERTIKRQFRAFIDEQLDALCELWGYST